ncbi:MAG: aminotransferase class IV, partial [Saprospiraceae bacterium]
MTNISITPVTKSRITEVDFDNLGFGKIFSDHMFVADYYDGAWHDYRIVPLEKMSIHPANMALHYGQSIFEGLKASKDKDGTPMLFRPEKNIERLNRSAVRMCMPEFPLEDLLEAMKTLVLMEKEWIPTAVGSSLYLRPFMFATDEYLGVAASTTYRLMILACPSGVYYSKPIKLLAEDHYVRAVKGGVGEAKTAGNYAASLYPAKLAREKGFDQILWLDGIYNKYVQE